MGTMLLLGAGGVTGTTPVIVSSQLDFSKPGNTVFFSMGF